MKVRCTMARDEGWLAPASWRPLWNACVWVQERGRERGEWEREKNDWESAVWVFSLYLSMCMPDGLTLCLQACVCLCVWISLSLPLSLTEPLSFSRWTGLLLSIFPLRSVVFINRYRYLIQMAEHLLMYRHHFLCWEMDRKYFVHKAEGPLGNKRYVQNVWKCIAGITEYT